MIAEHRRFLKPIIDGTDVSSVAAMIVLQGGNSPLGVLLQRYRK